MNNKPVFQANTLYNNTQTGLGLYVQDKWQLTSRITITYGVRWDGTWNPQPQSAIPGNTVWTGEGNSSRQSSVPQRVPDDFRQFRTARWYRVECGQHFASHRGSWCVGLLLRANAADLFPDHRHLQADDDFLSHAAWLRLLAVQRLAVLVAVPRCPSGASDLCTSVAGCPGIAYVDPSFRNPRVSNLTGGVEHSFSNNLTVNANVAYVHSSNLRTGGFSTTNWYRNFIPEGTGSAGPHIALG